MEYAGGIISEKENVLIFREVSSRLTVDREDISEKRDSEREKQDTEENQDDDSSDESDVSELTE